MADQNQTTITEIERMTLIGILALAREYRVHLDHLVEAACRITGEQREDGSHTSDAVWGGEHTADALLERVGKRVERQEQANV